MPMVYEFIISDEKLQQVLEEIKKKFPMLNFRYHNKTNKIFSIGDNFWIIVDYLLPNNYVKRVDY